MLTEVVGKTQAMQRDILPPGTFFAEAPRPYPYTVEMLQKSDIEAYRQVMLHIIRTMEHLTKKEKQEQIEKRTFQYYADALNNPQEWILLAAKDTGGNIVGVLESRVISLKDQEHLGQKAGFIHWTNVAEAHRRKGVATQLKIRHEDELRTRGIPWEVTGVRNTNTPSLKLNAKFGLTTPYATTANHTWYLKRL